MIRLLPCGEALLSDTAGFTIPFDCPACGAQQVQGRAYCYEIQNEFGIVIDRTSWVECFRCKEHLLSTVDPEQLARMDQTRRNAAISVYIPLLARALAVISLLISCFPFVGLLIALVAVWMNQRPGFWRKVSWFGLASSAAINLVCIGYSLIHRMSQ